MTPPVFNQLYGPMAEQAARLLWRNSGPVFAMDAMTRAYGGIWPLEGPLSLAERSLATVSALVAQELYPQIRLHINGFVSSGGTLAELFEFIGLAARKSGQEKSEALIDAILSGLEWRAQSLETFNAPSRETVELAIRREASTLKPEWRLLASLAAEIALGRIERMNEVMTSLAEALPKEMNRDRYMDLLITHLIVYCGYPKGMNAFKIWQDLRIRSVRESADEIKLFA
jgi:alkylhydroperoxidase/carboxymuconolactone decarboxylase family protein YurZ